MAREKKDFFKSELCKSRAKCQDCRMSVDYRRGIMKAFKVDGQDENFECPHGVKVKDFMKMPSLFQQAKNLVETATDVVKDVAKGEKVISEKPLAVKRMEICKECPFLKQDSLRCKKCGCNMKYKTKIKSAKCPIKKW